MVLDRDGNIYPLTRCGVALSRRFTFYDQVHTTGMDIKQTLDARAACTLGKDMTLRDHAQGVYRMRGLGKGQTITVLVVDEVRELILLAGGSGDAKARWADSTASSTLDGRSKKLEDVLAWLLLNSMRCKPAATRTEHLPGTSSTGRSLESRFGSGAFAAYAALPAVPAQRVASARLCQTARFRSARLRGPGGRRHWRAWWRWG